jgi:hypothetical protein
MTKMPEEICMGDENTVVGPMTKQPVFSRNFDPEKLQIPRKMKWHKGC